MKNNRSIFHPMKLVGALVFLMAFVLNIQTSLNGDWELVNVGFAQGSSGGSSGGSGGCKTGGKANINCPYWDVTITYTFTGPETSCTTGGEFTCN